MRYYFDTEFMEDGVTIDLVSIGVVDETGREFYMESADADLTIANKFVREHVTPLLQGGEYRRPRSMIRDKLFEFVAAGSDDGLKPEFWAWYGAYDWVALCQIFGRMVDLPNGWPMHHMDLKQLCIQVGNPEVPEQKTQKHHALNDAKHAKALHAWLAFGRDWGQELGAH